MDQSDDEFDEEIDLGADGDLEGREDLVYSRGEPLFSKGHIRFMVFVWMSLFVVLAVAGLVAIFIGSDGGLVVALVTALAGAFATFVRWMRTLR